MATIDEIFAAMPAEAAEDGREYLVIDPETRSITVPESERIFGVEADADAARKYFLCPRYVGDNLDLASMFLTVNYRNANGDEDGYLVEDVEIQGDYVTFSWQLWPKTVAYKGTLQFAVCADLPNTTHSRGPDWNTTLASGEVLEGLDPDRGDVEGETSDVVTQLRAEVSAKTAAVEAAGAAQVAKVQTEGSTQANTVKATGAQTEADALAAIKAQGEATLASIPAEYTDLANQVDKLTRDRAAAIVCQAEGERLQITDAGNDPLQGLRIFGKTEQWQTTGKNLLDVSEENALYVAGYKNYTVNAGRVINTNVAFFAFKMPVAYGTTYTVSLKKKATETTCHFRIYEYSAEPVAIAADDPNYIGNPVNSACAGLESVVKQYTPTADNVAWVAIGFYTTQNNVFYDFMAELGTEATAYEPYSGGVAAPCPAWPQELEHLPAPAVKVCGKNLFDNTAATKTVNGITFTINEDKSVTINGTATATIYFELGTFNLLPGEYYLSGCTDGSGTSYLLYFQKTADSSGYIQATTGQKAFTIGDTDERKMLIAVYSGAVVSNKTLYPMIRHTNTDDTYEPYKGATLTLANDLPGIPVDSGGNYTDANGQQWIADEVDLARGVYVQRVGIYTNDGSTTAWGINQQNETTIIFMAQTPCRPISREKQYYNMQDFNWVISANSRHNSGAIGESGILYCICSIAEFPDIAAFTARLNESPLVCAYPMAAPVERALTDAELQAYLALQSYKPTTTVLNDAGAHMVLEYAADPKTYIDNKLAALIAANT